MQLKRIIALFSVIVCFFSVPNIPAYAETAVPFINEDISLAYVIADAPSSNLRIANGTAYCISSTGSNEAVSITVTQTLQKHWFWGFWTNVDGAEWTKTNDNNSIRLSNSKSNLDNGTYRVKSVFTLTDIYGKSEKITIYSSEDKVL